jgi:hypothetical protein
MLSRTVGYVPLNLIKNPSGNIPMLPKFHNLNNLHPLGYAA